MIALERVLVAALIVAGASSCITFQWNRSREHRDFDRATLESLPKSGVGLDRCLSAMGAPTYVWENEVHGLVLAWSWSDDRTFSGTVSIPVYRSQSASLQYADVRDRQHGVVAWFDENWQLEDWREGYLNELVTQARRPATLDEIDAP